MAFVSPAHGGYAEAVLQQAHQVFHMWGFAGAPGGQVADRNNGNAELDRGEKTGVIHTVTEPNDSTIDERKGVEEDAHHGKYIIKQILCSHLLHKVSWLIGYLT